MLINLKHPPLNVAGVSFCVWRWVYPWNQQPGVQGNLSVTPVVSCCRTVGSVAVLYCVGVIGPVKTLCVRFVGGWAW